MKKGFTLIELLVVIAILAILATVIVVIINPGELLKQARDTSRISDLAALNSAIALYLSDVATPAIGTVANCTASLSPVPDGWGSCTVVTSTAVSGAGWVPINFTTISSGSPLARLPIDPVNSATYAYAYKSVLANLTYELDAKMESTKYSSVTTGVMRNEADGGDDVNYYEIGNKLDF